jgi:hypothetical protein
MHVLDQQRRVQMHLRNLPPDIARWLALATPADENALFLQLKSLDSFHRSTLVSRDTVALVNAPVVDTMPVSPVEGPDLVNRLASALVNAMELGQGSNARRGQSQQSRFDNKGYYKYPDNNRGRGGNRRGRQRDRYPQDDQEERGRAANFQGQVQNPNNFRGQGNSPPPNNSRGRGNGQNPNNSRGQGNRFRGGSRNRPKNHVSFAVDTDGNPVCAQCGDPSHFIAQCPQNPRNQEENPGRNFHKAENQQSSKNNQRWGN